MFENIINQSSVQIIEADILNKRLPQSLLFAGPENSAKLTTALELARVLSCTDTAVWNCQCESCKKMRAMNSTDLLIVGARDLMTEIKCSAAVFLKCKTSASHFLFMRAVKKILLRFDPRLWDSDENRFVKAGAFISDVQLLLSQVSESFSDMSDEKVFSLVEKSIDKIVVLCEKIQTECMYDTIPVNQVRKASEWIRLSPAGKSKFLIIENAELMQESARAAFLKILEEPPRYAYFILTTTRYAAIMQTILSRVRRYNFPTRDSNAEIQIVERVFHDTATAENDVLQNYFQKFLPVAPEKIKAAAFDFWKCVFTFYADKPETALPAIKDFVLNNAAAADNTPAKTVSQIINDLDKAKNKTVFKLFIRQIISVMQNAMQTVRCNGTEIEYVKKATDIIQNRFNAHVIYNISVQSTVENIAIEIGKFNFAS